MPRKKIKPINPIFRLNINAPGGGVLTNPCWINWIIDVSGLSLQIHIYSFGMTDIIYTIGVA